MRRREPPGADRRRRDSEESLVELLGGGRAAADATVPPVVFIGAWLVSGRSVTVGAVSALVVAAVIAGWRIHHGHQPRALVVAVLGVAVAAGIALYTGRAADFFLVQIVANAASALAWTVSIAVRWPLLGMIVGGVLGQRGRWRRDSVLYRAYSRASWVWVGQYVVRVAVFVPLWWGGQAVLLGFARVALGWPLVLSCLALSWWVLQRALPVGHPGLRHPHDD